METNNNTQFNDQTNGQTTIYQTVQKNGIGVAGFVMSITGLVLCWVPIIKWMLLIPALLLSFIGIFKKPWALAIVGSIVSALTIFTILLIKASFWGMVMSL